MEILKEYKKIFYKYHLCGLARKVSYSNRLKFLSEKAKKLQETKIISGFHDYRSEFGGKIQSWVSNSYRQEGEIKKQLFGFKDEKR